MKKLSSYLAVLFLLSSFFVTSCSDSDEKLDDPAPSPVEKEKEQVVSKLETIEEVSDFTAVFKDLDLDIKEAKLTLLATENVKESRAFDATGGNNVNSNSIKRHVIEGNHDILNFKGDTLVLTSIDGSELTVTKMGETIYVNGIALSKNAVEKISNSLIYIIKEIIPEIVIPVTKYKTLFNVQELTGGIPPEEFSQKVAEAMVYIYQENENSAEPLYNIIDSVKTDVNGQAIYKHDYETLFYTVNKADKSNMVNGYKIEGVFTSEEEVKSYPVWRDTLDIRTMPRYAVGNVKFLDKNGDGIINHLDKSTCAFTDSPSKTVDVYIHNGLAINNIMKMLSDVDLSYAQIIVWRAMLDLELEWGNNIYPDLGSLSAGQSYMFHEWAISYINGVNKIKEGVRKLSPKNQEIWAKIASRHDAQVVYSYSSLVEFYGDVPILEQELTEEYKKQITRSPKAEVIKYLESSANKIQGDYRYAAKQLVARLYLLENNENYDLARWAKIADIATEIIQSNKYKLEADTTGVLYKEKSVESMLGSSGLAVGGESQYLHPVRYTETLLIAMEANLELGKDGEAARYYNILQQRAGEPMMNPSLSKDEKKDLIRFAYGREMSDDAQWFSLNAHRWGILQSIHPTALPHNRLLPIAPLALSTYPKFTQNPGY